MQHLGHSSLQAADHSHSRPPSAHHTSVAGRYLLPSVGDTCRLLGCLALKDTCPHIACLALIADVEPQAAPHILVETASRLVVQSAMVATVKLAQADQLEQVGVECLRIVLVALPTCQVDQLGTDRFLQAEFPRVVVGGRCFDHLDHNLVPAVVDSFLEQAAHSTNLLSLGQDLDHKLGSYWRSTHWKMKTAVVEQDAVEQDMLVVPRD